MRLYPIGLLPLLFATSAYAQVVDLAQTGWELRRGGPLAEPIRLRPSAEPAPANQADANLLAPNVGALNEPYTGHSFLGGTLALGTSLGVYYDDNVFAGNVTRRSDTVSVARPEFAWQTNGQGYAVGVNGFLEAKAFDRYYSEDQINGSVGGAFKVAPTTDSQVLGSVRYIRGHLDRGTSETIAANGVLLSTLFEAPISYDQGTASLIYNKRFDSWWTSLGVNGTLIKFDNPSIGGIATVDLSYADGNVEAVNARVGHVVAPQTSVFGEVVANKRNFQVDAFGSQGYRAVGGVLLEPGPGSRVRGEAWAGYMNQDYNGPSFKTVSTFTYGGAVALAMTDQLTLSVEGRRDAKEAALSLGVQNPTTVGVTDTICALATAACVSAIQSTIGGRFDYRIMPNLVVGGGAIYIVDKYLGAAAGNRVDHTLSPVASLRYAATSRVTFGLDYRRLDFDPSNGASGIAASGYVRNVYLLSMAGRF